jgi:membrane-associated protein
MERRRFFVWSAVGAGLWIISITLLGYFLGAAFPWLGENIDYVTIAILALTVVPLAYEWIKKRVEHRRKGRSAVAQDSPESESADA